MFIPIISLCMVLLYYFSSVAVFCFIQFYDNNIPAHNTEINSRYETVFNISAPASGISYNFKTVKVYEAHAVLNDVNPPDIISELFLPAISRLYPVVHATLSTRSPPAC